MARKSAPLLSSSEAWLAMNALLYAQEVFDELADATKVKSGADVAEHNRLKNLARSMGSVVGSLYGACSFYDTIKLESGFTNMVRAELDGSADG